MNPYPSVSGRDTDESLTELASFSSKSKAWKMIVVIYGAFVLFTGPFWLSLFITGVKQSYWNKIKYFIPLFKWWIYWQPGSPRI